MHDVVPCGGVLHVPAVHHHRVLELLGPGLVVDSELVHVSVGHHHQLVHHAVELVVVGDGDGGAADLAELGAAGAALHQLHLEVLVLLLLHVVDDLDLEVALGLAMLEHQLALAADVVLAADGGLVHGAPLDGHVPVRAVLPDDGQLRAPDALLHQVASLLKLEGAGL